MNKKPIHVSLVVFPECDPSIIYGVFDTLWAAGRDFDADVGRRHALFEPRIVGSETGPMQAGHRRQHSSAGQHRR